MDESGHNEPSYDLKQFGFFVTGVVIFNGARKIVKKDGSIVVIVWHELSILNGIGIIQNTYDPLVDSDVLINNDEVIKYPNLELLITITAKGNRLWEYNGIFRMSDWQLV